MSCCAECEQGMGLYGLGELPPDDSGYAVGGSVVAWGGYIKDAVGNTIFDDRAESVIKNALWNTGGFSWVDAGRIAGFFNHYVSIKVTLKNDFSHFTDVIALIEGAIAQTGYKADTQAFYVESVPASAQAAASRGEIAGPGTGSTPNQPSHSGSIFGDWRLPEVFSGGAPSEENLLDKAARFFGVTTTQAIVIGAGGAVVAVIAAKRLL